MKRMLERMPLFGKVEARMLKFHPQQVDLFQVCEQLVEDERIEHSMSHSDITADFSANTVSGLFDEKLLHHIFGNLPPMRLRQW